MFYLRSVVAVSFVLAAPAVLAQASAPVFDFSVPAGSLEDALLDLSRQAGAAIAFRTDDLEGRATRGLAGRYTLEEAARRLLRGQPLAVRGRGEAALAIVRVVATGPPATTELESPSRDTVRVVGNLFVRTQALDARIAAPIAVDTIGSDELGRLPDRNAAESIDRLAGVSMLVEKGEGRYLQIRGMDPSLNAILLNGMPIGSPEAELGGRQGPLDMFSGGVLREVQVLKTRTPDMDAQGIGGALDLRTRRPAEELQSLRGDLSVRLGYESKRPDARAFGGRDPAAVSGAVSAGAPDGGVRGLAAASFATREYVGQGVYQDDWTSRGPLDLPLSIKNNYYVIGRDRVNFVLSGDARLGPDDTLALDAFLGRWDEFQHRLRYEQSLSQVEATGLRSGVAAPDRARMSLRLEHADKTIATLALQGAHTGERIDIDYRLQLSRNSLQEPFSSWEFGSGPVFGPGEAKLTDDNLVLLTLSPGAPDRSDPALYAFSRLRLFDRRLDERSLRAGMDLEWEGTGWLRRFKTGVSWARTRRVLDETEDRLAPGQDGITLAEPGFTNGAFSNRVAGISAPNYWMNIGELNAFLAANRADPVLFRHESAPSRSASTRADYDITESVNGLYAMATATHGPVEIIAGARMENAAVRSRGWFLEDGAASWREQSGNYLNWFPALLLNVRPQPELVIRASMTGAQARAPYDLVGASGSLVREGAKARITVGDPDLSPRTSTGYDLSLEWRPDPLSYLSVALFQKDIEGDPFLTTRLIEGPEAVAAYVQENHLPAGALAGVGQVELIRPVSVGGSSLHGLEVNAQAQLDDLPAPLDGLGLTATLTWLDGRSETPEGRAPLLGQPTRTYAAAAFYQRGPLDALVSYSYNDSYLTSSGDTPSDSLDQGAFGRWDARVEWRAAANTRLFIEGLNLTDEPTSEFQGRRESWNTEYEFVGRSYFAGLEVTF